MNQGVKRSLFPSGFTSSFAFRFSAMFIVRLKDFQSMPPPFGMSSFLQLCFRDFGCGKAMSFDESFRKDRGVPQKRSGFLE